MYPLRPLTRVLAVLTLFAASSAAHAIPIVGELTQESFGSDTDEGGLVFATIAVDTPANFAFDFSAVGETEIAFTWRAPAGKQIQITPPAGFSDYFLFARFKAAAGSGSSDNTRVNLATALPPFAPLSGSHPPDASFTTTGGGVDANALYLLEPGQTYLLTEITLTGTIPAALDGVFDSPVGVFELRAEAGDFNGPVPDAGQWMTIVSIPEPASLALLGLGAVLLARRRTARRSSRTVLTGGH